VQIEHNEIIVKRASNINFATRTTEDRCKRKKIITNTAKTLRALRVQVAYVATYATYDSCKFTTSHVTWQ